METMIYVPVKTCTLENYSEEWEECQRLNQEEIERIEKIAIQNGGLLYRFLYEGVADGKAVYQIIRVNQKTAKVRWCLIDGLFASYVVPQWGKEAEIPLEYAERQIAFQDMWRGINKSV